MEVRTSEERNESYALGKRFIVAKLTVSLSHRAKLRQRLLVSSGRLISSPEIQVSEGEKNHKKGGLNCVFGNFFFYILDNCPQVQSLK